MIEVDNARLGLLKAINFIYPQQKEKSIQKSSDLTGNIYGEFTYISDSAKIKNNVKIGHNCSINDNVLIGDNSYIGSCTTIDRAVFDSTIIGEFSHIDNLVQIAHNVVLGKHSIIAAQVGIAGSTVIGDNVKIGGQAGISGHLSIGHNVTIAAKSGVTKNLKDNAIVAGFPAIDIKKWKLNTIKFNRK